MEIETKTIESNSITVQIPEDLADYVMEQTKVCGKYLKVRSKGNSTHHLAKVMGFWLLLKAESPGSSLIQNYIKQMPELCTKFNICQRTFFTYIKELEAMKLASRDGMNIKVATWDQLARQLEINTRKRTQIKFEYAGKQKIHWWFAALEIKGNQERQAYMIWKKVNKNSDVISKLIPALVRRGFDTAKINNPGYFAGKLFMLYIEDFQTGTEVHEILINIRSDVNRGIHALSRSWDMSPQLVSYWKKKMQAQGIINVSKLTVQSRWSSETKECHKNKFCHVIWNARLKERIWFLCDQIDLIMPWKWAEFLTKNLAA